MAALRKAVAALASRVLPREFRARFGGELADAMRAAVSDARQRGGRTAQARYAVRELIAFFGLAITLHRQSSREDLRWALRRATRQPLSTVTVMLTLAASIAAVTTAFGLAEAILWRPLPYADAERLVFAWETRVDGERAPMRVTAARFSDWRARTPQFADMAIFGATGLTLDSADGATALRGVRASANYFDTLGVRPLLGRGFVAEDEVPGRHQVVVLSYDFWQGQFGGRPDVVGDTIRLSGTPYTVVGVMPHLMFPGWPVNPATVTVDREAHQVWVPVPQTPAFAQNAGAHVWGVVARLAPGVTLEEAARALAVAHPDASADPHAGAVQPLREQFVSDARLPLLLLLAATGAVLLIACANLAAIHLAMFESRRAELAMRTALGASTVRLARQLAFEALVSSVLAGMLGVGLARVALDAIPDLLPPHVPFMTAPQVDVRVALFGMAAAIAAAMALALWPIVQVFSGGLAARGVVRRGRNGVYRALVVLQVATAVGMVTTAALLAQSFRIVTGRDAGFAVDTVLVTDVGLPGDAYPSAGSVTQFERRLRERLAAQRGIADAALAYDHPLESNWSNSYTLVGGSGRGTDDSIEQAELRIVSPSYFSALGVQVLEGRSFTDREGPGARGVTVVNEALARRAGVPLLGRVVRSTPPQFTWGASVPAEFEIVGIVENERFRGLEHPTEPALYLSTLQFPQTSFALLARAGDATGVATMLRAAVREIEPRATVAPVRSLAAIGADQMAPRRVTTDVVGLLSAVALAVAALGVYGLLALAVAARRRDIGVRLAIGASPGRVGRQIIRESLTTAAAGIVIGAAITMAAGRVLERLLVDISARDPLTFAAVALVLLAVALAAAARPALRAARINPAIALRAE